MMVVVVVMMTGVSPRRRDLFVVVVLGLRLGITETHVGVCLKVCCANGLLVAKCRNNIE
jgi:hypothetical protein